ncbi:MAG: glutamine synthetase III [Clostridia bacterium]|nr:glutamine synthetase III [Clostridia bacterium]
MSSSCNLTSLFASNVFNDSVMRSKLPKNVYMSLKQTIKDGEELDSAIAEVVASAMKDWAIELGATHYCHWFIPLTGSPAEKHDAFLSLISPDEVIMEFSGKNLIKGEADASSFPSGGLRATFEARGYTAWDCTSPAFVKDGTLCIPTIYTSYTGEALDKKAPLLRSMQVVSQQSVRLLRLLGDDKTKRVTPSIGAEQEYFLVDEKYHSQRLDMKFAGKTLFGAMPPKGQEMDDHYYGNLKDRVSKFMAELDVELWKLGITSKTKHNEVAPAQHELAPIYEIASVACDRNHLTMEVMKKVAKRHGLRCLLNEKPFAGINGSGKHNNWSLSTDGGENLFKPGKNIANNKKFLLFSSAVIRAVDLHADLLRFSVASAGNDCRLGGHEAPPTILSIFLGQELTDIFESFVSGSNTNNADHGYLNTGIKTMPNFQLDSSDRNRTSPFAFTGDKFEFRMLGAPTSVASCNIMLNTIVAESLDYICGILEKADDLDKAINDVIKDIFAKHKRIVFNGDGYSAEWHKEAERRGLPLFNDTVDVAPCLTKQENIDLLSKYGIFTPVELNSRYEITLRIYNKTKNIEAKTMVDMAEKQFLPAGMEYAKFLTDSINSAKASGIENICSLESKKVAELSQVLVAIDEKISALKYALQQAYEVEYGHTLERATVYRDKVDIAMSELRNAVDKMEGIIPRKYYPVPTYVELLFGVN